ncbi:MAG: alpha/beta hydrolase [Lachnospiraceae bacterium]|jgi:pimeloyl-ACP methyl ester carboxylesterase
MDNKPTPKKSSKKSGTVRKICFAAGGATLAAITAASVALASSVTRIKPQTLGYALAWQKDHYDISWFSGLRKKKYTVTSEDGYRLHVVLCENPNGGNKYVIFSHGYTDNRYGDLKYMKIYLDRGYNCVIYDLRGHGENEPARCTYSCREAEDLYALIQDTRKRFGQRIILGLHGESLGAAVTAAVMKYHPHVDFAVCDCGFADIENVIRGGMKEKHIPQFLYYTTSLACRICYGYFFGQMKPIRSLEDCDVPMLFIHGGEDKFITPDNSLRMRREVKGYSEYHQIAGAGHAESVLRQPQRYREIVNSFLDTIEC